MTAPHARPILAPLAGPDVALDGFRAEARQAIEERAIHRATCRWLRQGLCCSMCRTADERVRDAARRLALALEREGRRP